MSVSIVAIFGALSNSEIVKVSSFLKIESDYSSDSPDPAPVQCGGGVIRPLTWAQL